MINEFLSNIYDEVDYEGFYRELFPVGSFEDKGVMETGKYNGIAVAIGKGKHKIKRYTVTDDLAVITDLVASDDFCLMSPISYAGKTRKSQYARFMYALAIDLDGVTTDKRMRFFLKQCEEGEKMLSFVWGLPKPTFLVSSGTGIHIYYVFKKPIPLFKNIVKELEKLKKRLTWQAWTQGASELHDNVQYESLFQGFRMVGTITKVGDRARAYRVGDKVDVEYLNAFVPTEYQAEKFVYKSDLRLDKAKELYPEWYQKRVVEKRPRGYWATNRAVYEWWKKQVRGGAEQGHRYWCIMTLATYAKKCSFYDEKHNPNPVTDEELEKDALDLIPFMNSIGTEPFTEDDVMSALEAFTDSYVTYPIHTIVNRTGIAIEQNKRNGRKQEIHIKYMNNQRAFKVEMGECTNGGRPKGSDKSKLVTEWRKAHPDGKKIECHKETGLSRMTIDKWWNTKGE